MKKSVIGKIVAATALSAVVMVGTASACRNITVPHACPQYGGSYTYWQSTPYVVKPQVTVQIQPVRVQQPPTVVCTPVQPVRYTSTTTVTARVSIYQSVRTTVSGWFTALWCK